METSFIPKKNYNRRTAVEKKYVGWFLAVSSFIFVIMVVTSAGVFFYKSFLEGEIRNKNEILKKEKGRLELPIIQKLSKFDKKIEVAKNILDNHVSLVYLFNFLEANTLKEVMFNNFNFQADKDGYFLTLEGKATSYGDVAIQSDILSESKDIIDPIFSDLRVDNMGHIAFKVEMKLDSKLISYKDNLEVE